MLLPDMIHVSQPGLAETVAALFPPNRDDATSRVEEEVRSSCRRKLWVIMTHPMASERTLCTAGEELHMLLRNASLSSFVNGIRALSSGAFHAGAGDTVLVQRNDHDAGRHAHQNA